MARCRPPLPAARDPHGELEALLRHSDAVLIDVTPAPRKPAGLAPNAVWMPAQHRNIASSVWLSDLGAGVMAAGQDTWFRARLKELSRGKRDTPLVLYCHPQCWASWNAAKRAISYGYRKVYWYPDGIEGWEKAGLPTASAVAILPPSDPVNCLIRRSAGDARAPRS